MDVPARNHSSHHAILQSRPGAKRDLDATAPKPTPGRIPASATTNSDTTFGGNGPDKIEGNDNNDYLYGRGGDDLLEGNGGDDRLSGGSGTDAASNCAILVSIP